MKFPSIQQIQVRIHQLNYVANKANLVVKYVDENGKELLPTETKEGKVGDDYSTSGKVITGYVLDRVEGEAKGKIGKEGSTVNLCLPTTRVMDSKYPRTTNKSN